jgi:hypothetical protein
MSFRIKNRQYYLVVLLLVVLTNYIPAQITWPDGRYFPHFPEPDTIYVDWINCPIGSASGAWDAGWRIDQSTEIMHCLTLAGMQGIINRQKPAVFLNWQDTTGHFDAEINGAWAGLLDNYVNVVNLSLSNIKMIDFLWQKYSGLFTGAVIYDPAVPETINLATMIAGLEDRMILGPGQISLPGIPAFRDITDLRILVQQQGWDDSFESQLAIEQWVYDNLWPDLEHRIISMESAGPPTSGDKETPDFFFPPGIASRDYMVALRLPVLYLNPKYSDHYDLFAEFLADAPSPIAVSGAVAFNENGVVWESSEFGNIVSATTWPGEAISGGNLTVISGVHPSIKKIGSQIDQKNILKTLGEQPVVTLFASDGDALFFQLNRGFRDFFAWEDVQGQKFAWETNPILSELAPLAWNYYQDSKDEVTFTAGISGFGYCDPHKMDTDQFSAYLDKGAPYMEETGLRVIRFNGLSGPWNATFDSLYYNKLKDYGYLGTIVGFQPNSPNGLALEYNNTPAPVIRPAYYLLPSNRDAILNDLLSKNPNESLIECVKDSNIPEIASVDDDSASGDTAILISTDFINSQSYSLAFSSEPQSLFPGNYDIRYRLKVTDNSSSGVIARLFAGYFDPQKNTFVFLANRSIHANDFQSDGRYEEFSYSLDLAELTPDVELRIDYGDGSTDLYADNIRITNNSEAALPVFAPLYLNLGADQSELPGMTRLVEEFTEVFESQGGIVLTPDEFMAALNPEYMIDLGSQLLGDNDPDVIQAQQQLDNGQYLASLFTVRSVLSTVSNTES